MTSRSKQTDRPTAALISIGVAVGFSLSAVVGSITGDWYWTPIILSACIGLGALATLLGLRFKPK